MKIGNLTFENTLNSVVIEDKINNTAISISYDDLTSVCADILSVRSVLMAISDLRSNKSEYEKEDFYNEMNKLEVGLPIAKDFQFVKALCIDTSCDVVIQDMEEPSDWVVVDVAVQYDTCQYLIDLCKLA